MFNILTDELPKSVNIDGVDYEIRWGFRAMIKIEQILQDDEYEMSHRRAMALNMFYPEMPPDILEAERQMLQFYATNKPKNQAQKSAEARNENASALYSYDHDDEYIYAAFRQQYGINLSTVEGLHWFEFRAMMRGLTEDSVFTKIRGYRGMDLSKIKDNSMRQMYAELKEYWALPLPESVQEVVDELEAALMGDGDLSALKRRLNDG